MMAPSHSPSLVSSSSTLWATASKEWVIQPKPKPGRKPKKDVPSPPKAEEQLDNKGRRVQNRAAQRAFRERKQSQLAELQARVQSYEQGEIERNVALQNIAKRLKDENETLRLENSLLKERLQRIGQEHEPPHEHDKKRWRESSPPLNASLPPQARKRSKVSPAPLTGAPSLTASYTPSPPSMVSSPDSNGTSDTRFSPPYETRSDSHHPGLTNMLDFPPHAKPTQLDHGIPFPAFDCGFCNEDTPCVCREIAAQQAAERIGAVDFKAETYTQTNTLDHTIRFESSPQTSILENLPAYQPAVPLRRRVATPTVNNIFAVAPPVVQRLSPASCSGDPSNCGACADDAFGKAFCRAIEESVAAQPPCSDCPCNQGQPLPMDYDNSNLRTNPSSISPDQSGSKTIPTNDAWRQLKSHPNVAFADLSLLADVVARRSKCTGPRVVISPALGSITPERTVSPEIKSASQSEHGPILLTDPHAHYREQERARSSGPSPPPRLVPQDVLMRCRRQRVREVQTNAVQAALHLLDTKFS